MKIIPLASILLIVAGVAAACAPKAKEPIGHATVNATHASLRSRNSATSRTLKVMEPGERVELLEQQDRWYKVRFGEIEGWMEVSTILTEDVQKRIQATVDSARDQVPQNTGLLLQDANLRIEPGRSTSVLRRLAARTTVDVLERKTIPREDLPGRFEAWLKVRSGAKDVGWLLSSFVEFNIPEEIERYTEEFTYSTVKTLREIDDPIAGKVRWYIVGERKSGLDSNLDFDGIRVFTWNASKQRYETAFRKRGIRGVYPLEVKEVSGNPTFTVYELGADGTTKEAKDFVMNGVVVREAKKPKG